MKTLSVAFSVLLLGGCGLCNNTVKSTATSPDGKWVATAVVRDCGATTDYSPQVHLLKPGKSVRGIGNAFVGDHSSQIKVKWLSATNLIIYSDCKVIKHVTNYHGITIAHQKEEPRSTQSTSPLAADSISAPDLEQRVGQRVVLEGIVSNTKCPQVQGVDAWGLEEHRGQRVRVSGILRKTVVTEADINPLVANRGAGTFYSLEGMQYELLK